VLSPTVRPLSFCLKLIRQFDSRSATIALSCSSRAHSFCGQMTIIQFQRKKMRTARFGSIFFFVSPNHYIIVTLTGLNNLTLSISFFENIISTSLFLVFFTWYIAYNFTLYYLKHTYTYIHTYLYIKKVKTVISFYFLICCYLLIIYCTIYTNIHKHTHISLYFSYKHIPNRRIYSRNKIKQISRHDNCI
jgi:hypothetical protein